MSSSHHPLRAVQFDNLKRIYRTVEDMPGRLADNIKANYVLPTELSEYVL